MGEREPEIGFDQAYAEPVGQTSAMDSRHWGNESGNHSGHNEVGEPSDSRDFNCPSRPSQVRKHIVVTGMVQGVGFRYESVRAARRIGIVGWVRNCMDGSVELEIQGGPEPVAQMIEWLWHGPQWARVDDVTVESEVPRDPAHAERTFLVVR